MVTDIEKLVFAPPELGCVLYLPGPAGGGSKIYDQSPYGNIGTITGATWVRLLGGLWVLDFDGMDDKVTITHNTSLQPGAGSFSLIFWLYSHDLLVDPDNAAGIVNKGANVEGFDIRIRNNGVADGDSLQCQLNDGTTRDVPVINFDSALVINTWYCIGVDYDRTNDKVYLHKNGVKQAAEGALTATGAIEGTNNILLGEDYDGKSFDGLIALPRIRLHHLLTALDHQNIFNREKYLFGVW